MASAVEKILSRKDLGFWQLPEREFIWQGAEEFGRNLRRTFDHLIVLGMGGSALGGKCLVECLASAPNVTFVSNTDPTGFERVLNNPKYLESAHFMAISKSGMTLELACMIDVLMSRINKKDLSKRLSVITEPPGQDASVNSLRRFAEECALQVVDHPLDVGGRFSALTPVGLVPAAFAGVDLKAIREGAKRALTDRKNVEGLATRFAASFERGEAVTAFWSYVDELHAFLPWLQQLWAESLGKSKQRNGKRCAVVTSVPTIYEGTCDQHSVLQQLMEGLTPTAVVFFREKMKRSAGPQLTGNTIGGYSYLNSFHLGEVFDTQSRSTEQALKEVGRTTIDIEFEQFSASTLGHLMMTFELVIGALGELLDIDVFNQPGVELGKKITKAKLQETAQ